MVFSFKEISDKYKELDLSIRFFEELNKMELNDIHRIKEKAAVVLNDFNEKPVDEEDREFLLENIIKFCLSKNLLDEKIGIIINMGERKIIELLPPGFNVGALLHPDFPYTIGFVNDGFDIILTNHKLIMDQKKVEIEKLKSQPNGTEILTEVEKLNNVLGFKAIDKKNEKRDLELVNKALSLFWLSPT